jgi:hypothetical protein
MSTESSATATMEAPVKTDKAPLPNVLRLTHEGLYLLEACLRQMSGVTSMQQAVLWEKVQRKARRTNNRLIKTSWSPEGHDLEAQILMNEGEKELDWATRKVEWGNAVKRWQDGPISFALSNKHFTAAKDAVKFVFDNGYKEGTKCQVALPLNEHVTTLFIELKLADAEPDDE